MPARKAPGAASRSATVQHVVFESRGVVGLLLHKVSDKHLFATVDQGFGEPVRCFKQWQVVHAWVFVSVV